MWEANGLALVDFKIQCVKPSHMSQKSDDQIHWFSGLLGGRVLQRLFTFIWVPNSKFQSREQRNGSYNCIEIFFSSSNSPNSNNIDYSKNQNPIFSSKFFTSIQFQSSSDPDFSFLSFSVLFFYSFYASLLLE